MASARRQSPPGVLRISWGGVRYRGATRTRRSAAGELTGDGTAAIRSDRILSDPTRPRSRKTSDHHPRRRTRKLGRPRLPRVRVAPTFTFERPRKISPALNRVARVDKKNPRHHNCGGAGWEATNSPARNIKDTPQLFSETPAAPVLPPHVGWFPIRRSTDFIGMSGFIYGLRNLV